MCVMMRFTHDRSVVTGAKYPGSAPHCTHSYHLNATSPRIRWYSELFQDPAKFGMNRHTSSTISLSIIGFILTIAFSGRQFAVSRGHDDGDGAIRDAQCGPRHR